MSKTNEPTINSRFGSSFQSVSHYQYSDRRMSTTPSNLFRSNTSSRRNQHKPGTSATSV